MKLLKSIAVMMLIAGPAFSQVIGNVKKGPDNDQNTKILKVLGESSAGIFYMAAKGDDLYVQRYNAGKLNIEIANKIEIPRKENTKLEIEEMFLMDNEILLFATGYSSDKDAFITYSFIINNKCEIENDGNLVFTMPVEKKRRSGKVGYELSPDRKNILIFNGAFMKKEGIHRYSFILLDDKGKEVTQQGFEVPEAEGRETVEVEDLTLDANNDIHAVVSRSLRDRKTKELNQNFEVISYRKKNDYSPVTAKLTLGANNIISSVIIAARNNGDLTVGGFYVPMKNGKRATGLEGTFFAVIGEDGSTGDVKLKPFSDDFKGNFIKERKVEKGADIPLTYTMKNAFVSQNDEISFVAEDFVFTEGSGGAGAGDTYYYGYIIVVKVSDNGDIVWEQLINKRQLYQEVGMTLSASFVNVGSVFTTAIGVSAWISFTSNKNIYLSYKTWSKGSDIFFLFNDDSDNKDKVYGEKRDVMSRSMKSIPMIAKVDDRGIVTYSHEDELGDEETTIRPKMSLVREGKLYFITAKRTVEKVGVAEIK